MHKRPFHQLQSLLKQYKTSCSPIRSIVHRSTPATTRSFTRSTAAMAEIKTISTDKALLPVAHYSQAKVVPVNANMVFVSGQVPVAPGTKFQGGSIQEQTKLCIDNMRAILTEAGSGLDRVIKVNAYLSDMAHFAGFNEEYSKHFPGKPARTAFAVKGLPLGIDIEIECTALGS